MVCYSNMAILGFSWCQIWMCGLSIFFIDLSQAEECKMATQLAGPVMPIKNVSMISFVLLSSSCILMSLCFECNEIFAKLPVTNYSLRGGKPNVYSLNVVFQEGITVPLILLMILLLNLMTGLLRPLLVLLCSFLSLVSLVRLCSGVQEGEGPRHHRGGEEVQGFRQPAYGPCQRPSLWHPCQEGQGGRRSGRGEEEIKTFVCMRLKIKICQQTWAVLLSGFQ